MMRLLIQYNHVRKAFVPILLDFSVSEEKLCQVTASGYLYIEMQTQVRFVGNLAQQQIVTEQLINFSLEWIQ